MRLEAGGEISIMKKRMGLAVSNIYINWIDKNEWG